MIRACTFLPIFLYFGHNRWYSTTVQCYIMYIRFCLGDHRFLLLPFYFLFSSSTICVWFVRPRADDVKIIIHIHLHFEIHTIYVWKACMSRTASQEQLARF